MSWTVYWLWFYHQPLASLYYDEVFTAQFEGSVKYFELHLCTQSHCEVDFHKSLTL